LALTPSQCLLQLTTMVTASQCLIQLADVVQGGRCTGHRAAVLLADVPEQAGVAEGVPRHRHDRRVDALLPAAASMHSPGDDGVIVLLRTAASLPTNWGQLRSVGGDTLEKIQAVLPASMTSDPWQHQSTSTQAETTPRVSRVQGVDVLSQPTAGDSPAQRTRSHISRQRHASWGRAAGGAGGGGGAGRQRLTAGPRPTRPPLQDLVRAAAPAPTAEQQQHSLLYQRKHHNFQPP